MLDESLTGRVGNEVASFLMKRNGLEFVTFSMLYITDRIISSDIIVSYKTGTGKLLWDDSFIILNRKTNLKCLTSGHTHLGAAGDHSIIERERTKVSHLRIATPWDWLQVVRLCDVRSALCLQVRKHNPGVLFYKTNFGEEFSTISLTRNTTNK
nr:unnamed protein product [Callosobruchus chinensis]